MLSMSAALGAGQSDSHPTHPPCTPPARYDAWITKAWDTPSLFPLIIMSINNIYPLEDGQRRGATDDDLAKQRRIVAEQQAQAVAEQQATEGRRR